MMKQTWDGWRFCKCFILWNGSTAGQGIGIDRLSNDVTNQHSIRDVLLFPAMKP